MEGNVLEVSDLAVAIETPRGPVRAVDDVSFHLPAGGALAVVGESGCGKTLTALSLLRLLPPAARLAGGRILLRAEGGSGTPLDLAALPERALRAVRGRRVAMVFQEPMTALNPVLRVGDQIGEALRVHEGASRRAAIARAVDLLRLVGLPAPEARVRAYPHELSGGMRQRVLIAMALAARPEVVIADEPTTALDPTVQAQVLDLLARLRAELGLALVLITHDVPVVGSACEDILVMYAGRVVERGRVAEVLAVPRHPYTAALLRSVPRLDAPAARGRLHEIPGAVPSLESMLAGCRFAARCPRVQDDCRDAEPPLIEISPAGPTGHAVRCLHPEPAGGTA